jgi:hypothetical protein
MNNDTYDNVSTSPGYNDKQIPVYQTSIAVNLAIAIVAIFVVFNGPRVGC